MTEELNPVDIQKRELLGATQTITKLQERIERLENENREYKDKYNEISQNFKKERQNYDDVVSLLKDDISKLTEKRIQLENDLSSKIRKIEENEEIWRHQLEQKQIEWDAEKLSMVDKYKILETKYNLISEFERDKSNLEADRKKLQEDLDHEKKDKVRALADKDREKVQATDKLKKDMLHKIQETKTNLLALKKEQLKTTTRLTVLQNHQLTTELEYQSKQTEKLLFKNAKLQEQVTTLKRDVEIHKQVEAELAKRSHYAQTLIKKMSERIKELETENISLKSSEVKNSNPDQEDGAGGDKNKEELITFLEKNLESTERRLAKLQNDYDILKNEYDFMELKIEASNNKFANAALLLKDNLDQLLYVENPDQEGVESAKRLALDLSEIKGKQIEDLDTFQKQMLLNILLEQIKPYLNKKMLANHLYEIEKGEQFNYNNRSGALESGSQLPNIYEKSMENKFDQNKFHDVPLEVSARIVRSNLRDWGKPVSMPAVNNNKGRYKYKL